ncbi:MAG: ATP-binding protein [Chloroflexota bacterium]
MPVILVAVADQEILTTLRQRLMDDGLTLVEAHNAPTCLLLAKEVNPDCILLDDRLQPPEGDSLVAALHTEHPLTPIFTIIVDESNAIDAAFADGTTDIIVRPIRWGLLSLRMRRLLEQAELHQLRQRDEWYRSIFEQTSEGVFRSTAAGQFVFVNQGLVRLLGYESIDEVLALNIPDELYMRREEREDLRRHSDLAGDTQSYEIELKSKSGNPIPVNVSSRAIRDADGNILVYEGIIIDLTDKKQAEKALNQYGDVIRAKSESLQTLNTIADVVYESLDLRTVIENALDAVLGYFHVSAATLQLVDESGEFLKRFSARELSSVAYQLTAMTPLRGTLSGEAVATRQLIISDHLSRELRLHPQLRDDLIAHEVTHLVVIPLLSQGNVIGTVSLPLHNDRILTEQERETLAAAGKSIGLAIANAQYVERIEAEVQERMRIEFSEHQQRILAEALRDTAAALNGDLNQDRILDQILIQMERVIPSNTSNVMLVENDFARIVRARGYEALGISDGSLTDVRYPVATTVNLHWLVETGRALAIPDVTTFRGWVTDDITWWIGSHVSAPIKIEGEVIGFLNVDSAEPYAFEPNHAHALETFASQVAIAIRNARLYDEARRYASQLEDVVKERTAEVENQRAQLQAILDGTGDGLTGVIFTEPLTLENVDTVPERYRYINQALLEMVGYTPEEWHPNLLRMQQQTPEEYQTFLHEWWHTLVTTGRWKGEQIIRRKDGTEFPSSTVSTLVRAADGNAIGAVTIFRDISQEKVLEAQKERFISNAAHELRTPITNLKTRLYLARKQPERMDVHLQILEQVTDHMKNLAEYLLDLSRIERGVVQLHRERLDLEQFIADMVVIQQPEAEKKNLTLTLDVPLESLVVLADPGRINQVVSNLIVNAINYTPAGGAVRVKLTRGVGDESDFAVIQVSDTGIGIAAEHLPHIFQPFYQANQTTTGVGLGLSISKEIIEMHGGHLRVESEVDKGTCFSVALRLQEIEQPV